MSGVFTRVTDALERFKQLVHRVVPIATAAIGSYSGIAIAGASKLGVSEVAAKAVIAGLGWAFTGISIAVDSRSYTKIETSSSEAAQGHFLEAATTIEQPAPGAPPPPPTGT